MRQAVGRNRLSKYTDLTARLMRIVITGGAGFLGSRLARALLAHGSLTDARGEARDLRELVLVDVVRATVADPRVTVVTGDLTDPTLIERVVTPGTDSVFHLAAVVSGQAEAEFDVGMRVNLDATLYNKNTKNQIFNVAVSPTRPAAAARLTASPLFNVRRTSLTKRFANSPRCKPSTSDTSLRVKSLSRQSGRSRA